MTKRHYVLLREAADLELQAAINQSYACAMERTCDETGGRLGTLNAPHNYAAHVHGAESKRLRAAALRDQVRAEIAGGTQ